VLTQHLDIKKISLNYDTLSQKYGINWIADYVEGIDSVAQTVQLRSGETLSYDRLVLAPGIDFINVSGLDSQKIPHAWQAGEQTLKLQEQLLAMPNGGTFIITIPKGPYRCPPGPYERACAVAEFIEQRKSGGKVVVLDANDGIISGKKNFTIAFDSIYRNTIEYHTGVELQAVDSDARIAQTNLGDFQADVLNVIPTQTAGKIIHTAQLANDPSGRWATVNPLSYESTTTPNIHIIGDSQATGQPKAGHIANSEAKICADAILRSLAGEPAYAAPVTNSACYSPITSNTASWLTGVFAYDVETQSMKAVPNAGGEAQNISKDHFKSMYEWTGNLFNDAFA
jgi:NADH dehydrogenase FAD-containing subunit